MSPRGPYAKGVAKRAEILETALEIIARNGYSGATVRELADAVGLSQNGLLHYFGSKDALFAEILRRRDEIDAESAASTDDLVDGMLAFIRRNAEVPGLVQLYARLSNEAAERDHPSHDHFRKRYEALRETWTTIFEGLDRDGRLPAGARPERLAVLMIALVDGLQTQWMYDESIDMAEHLGHFFDTLGVRR